MLGVGVGGDDGVTNGKCVDVGIEGFGVDGVISHGNPRIPIGEALMHVCEGAMLNQACPRLHTQKK